MSSYWLILTKLRCKLPRGCYTQATCLATLRKVEGRSTFLATCNATNVAGKIASCNMAFTWHKYHTFENPQTIYVFNISCVTPIATTTLTLHGKKHRSRSPHTTPEKFENGVFHPEFVSNVICVHHARELQNCNNHRPFWIYVRGRLGEGNHMIIVTSSFSRHSVFQTSPVHSKMYGGRF